MEQLHKLNEHAKLGRSKLLVMFILFMDYFGIAMATIAFGLPLNTLFHP
jgi:hypothetical protein